MAKQDNPVEAFGALLRFDWIMGIALTQSASGFFVRKNLNAIFTVWLVLSDCPSVCGWYAVDISNLVSSLLNRALQNSDINFGSLSEMILSGIPQSAISSRSSSASAQLRAVHVDFPGITVTRLEVLHVTDNAVSMWPGRAMIKSIANVLKRGARSLEQVRDSMTS